MGTSSGLKAIGNSCASLKELNLSKCAAVTDESISFLVQTHKELEKLDITCCGKITHASIYDITNLCSRLTSLRMESCSLVSTDAFWFIGKCQLLEELDVTDTDIDDEGCISNLNIYNSWNKTSLPSVHDLCLLICCVGLKSISGCTKLSSLKLGICLRITDNGLKHIARCCSELKNLDLYRYLVSELCNILILMGENSQHYYFISLLKCDEWKGYIDLNLPPPKKNHVILSWHQYLAESTWIP